MHIALIESAEKTHAINMVQKFASSFLTGFLSALTLGSLVSVPDYGFLGGLVQEFAAYIYATL